MTGAASPALPGFSATRIYLACGVTDMRKGFDGLAVLVQQVLEQSPHTGVIFAFRGKALLSARPAGSRRARRSGQAALV